MTPGLSWAVTKNDTLTPVQRLQDEHHDYSAVEHTPKLAT